MDDIESSVTEINKLILEKAPRLRPAVFPTNMRIKSIFDICSESSDQRIQIQRWMEKEQCTEEQVAFATEFDYKQRIIRLTPIKCENDSEKSLCSLETIMGLLVSESDRNLLSIFNSHFLDMNNYDQDNEDNQNILYEVCNLCYSLKVLISNIPGIKFMLGEHLLPFNSTEDVYAVLRSLSKASQHSSVAAESTDVSDQAKSAKKRRKKRGGG